MFLEIIGLDHKDVINTKADRIELVSAMDKGGLSPKLEVVKEVVKTSKVPIRVMVRFHDDNYVYDEFEIKKMCDYIDEIAKYQIEGIVLGCLNTKNEIDENLMKIIEKKVIHYNLKWTFHRAFDEVKDFFEALKIIKKYQVDTILTSAGLSKPIEENYETLKEIQKQSGNIKILLGGGINKENIQVFKNDFEYFHVGSAVRDNKDFSIHVNQKLVEELKNDSRK